MQEIESRLGRYLAFVANRAVYAIRRAWVASAASRGIELTPEEFMVLEMLVVKDGLTQSELTEVAVRDRTTVTRLVDGLVRKSLVRREQATGDRRIVHAHITARGRRTHELATAMAQALRAEAMVGVEPGDLATAMAVLHRVRCNMLQYSDGAAGAEPSAPDPAPAPRRRPSAAARAPGRRR